jgi:hypothetical protein
MGVKPLFGKISKLNKTALAKIVQVAGRRKMLESPTIY